MRRNIKRKRIHLCLVSSSGGHLEQLLRLTPLLECYGGCIVTEQVGYKLGLDSYPIYYIPAINRTDAHFVSKLIRVFITGTKILRKERPAVIISTGAVAALPLLMIGKLQGSKIIYIESFAKVDTPSLTGKVAYRLADQFYVQWEPLLAYYPKAIYLGGIY